ncbi:cell division protein ZapE [Sciscionella marina]|uniref:cell division protein ZapE n=1 Tax=Sciscionella marina TaxID=508770 RepID=UPI00037725FD|nr:cell division protein ZapE [Sciscionella marina]
MSTARLSERSPSIAPEALIASMVPPPRFDKVRFDTYIPNPEEPSQAEAVTACAAFARGLGAPRESKLRKVFGRASKAEGRGLYLDGGFGVGKTHLLASIWHAAEGEKAYGTFVELTNLVGALGFRTAVEKLSGRRLLAIDEFELDDPGDTMLVTKLISELADAGVSVAATSNTLPGKLGEGRFAAEDFLREIHAMASRFDVVRVDGPDYRHRGLPEAPAPRDDQRLRARAEATAGATLDGFDELCEYLATLHPSKYGVLLDGIELVCLSQTHAIERQDVALRFVALADRLYDRAIPVAVSGKPIPELFTEEMLAGGYRKKYLRAISRLIALSRDAGADAG